MGNNHRTTVELDAAPKEPTLVKHIMTSNVRTVHPKAITMQVTRLMATYDIRHLVVSEDAVHVLGVISQRDLLKHITRCFTDNVPPSRTEVWEFMNVVVLTIEPEKPIYEAAQLVEQRKIGCLPVVDEKNRLVGIITRSDLLRHMGKSLKNRMQENGGIAV